MGRAAVSGRAVVQLSTTDAAGAAAAAGLGAGSGMVTSAFAAFPEESSLTDTPAIAPISPAARDQPAGDHCRAAPLERRFIGGIGDRRLSPHNRRRRLGLWRRARQLGPDRRFVTGWNGPRLARAADRRGDERGNAGFRRGGCLGRRLSRVGRGGGRQPCKLVAEGLYRCLMRRRGDERRANQLWRRRGWRLGRPVQPTGFVIGAPLGRIAQRLEGDAELRRAGCRMRGKQAHGLAEGREELVGRGVRREPEKLVMVRPRLDRGRHEVPPQARWSRESQASEFPPVSGWNPARYGDGFARLVGNGRAGEGPKSK